MKKNAKNRRGFTLAELTIVLAVIAIVSTMVVSYVTIITQRNRAATERLNVMQDIQVIESMTEAWIEDKAENGLFVICEGNIVVDEKLVYQVLKDPVNGDTIGFDETEKTYNGYKTTAIESVTYDSSPKPLNYYNGGDILYFVTVTYELSDKNGLQTYTFCVNPYVGEGVN